MTISSFNSSNSISMESSAPQCTTDEKPPWLVPTHEFRQITNFDALQGHKNHKPRRANRIHPRETLRIHHQMRHSQFGAGILTPKYKLKRFWTAIRMLFMFMETPPELSSIAAVIVVVLLLLPLLRS